MNLTEKQLREINRRLGIKELAAKEADVFGSIGGVGKRPDLDGMFFRSSWEANIARYLNYLRDTIRAVREWKYESREWKFPKIKRGTRSYRCDFEIWFLRDETPTYWEVKGWMDPVSKTKLKRMALYYPDVKIIVIDQAQYREIARQWKGAIPNWETGREYRASPRRTRP